ncbi:MAG: RNA-binding protein [Methanobacteriaceae archaeon]|nr:RNA-binding protein [Methanobacteriaceae archaeon]
MIHNISYRVFVYGTENEEKVREAIKTLFPNSLPEKDTNQGYYGNNVVVLHEKIDKKRDIRDLIKKFQNLDYDVKNQIIKGLNKKIDNKGNLFLRFDKQEAYLGNLVVVEHGDSIHLKIKIAAYPSRKDKAIKIAKEMLGEKNVL